MIDFSAREAHFADHLAPVWHQLPAELRGTFWAGPPAAARLAALGVPATVGEPQAATGPVVVAAWGDLARVRQQRRPIVLFEHGAGQSYSTRHPSYCGGRGRETVSLFLVPNEQAAGRNRRYYPTTPNVVVGSPRVDRLAGIRRQPGPPTVAVSWHWRCKVAPEAGTAFDHYRRHLASWNESLAARGITLLGHGHPRIFDEVRVHYHAAGIEAVDNFDELVAHADVLVCDNSSALFEWAALDRPVVVANCPRYRRRARHGGRFWDWADSGTQVNSPAEVVPAVVAAFDHDPAAARRRAVAAEVYPIRGAAAARAADTLAALVPVPAATGGGP